MVKVSIRDYMPPYTSWMQVELEDGVCNGSPAPQNPSTKHNGKIDVHANNTNFSYEYQPADNGHVDWN